MKNNISLILLFVFCTIASYSQSQYSQQNPEQPSFEELYLIKAKKLKKTGAILSLAGSSAAVAGYAMFSASWAGNFGGGFTAGAGLIMFIVGIPVTAIGLPILITNSSRVTRITRIINKNPVSLELAPCSFQHYLSQNYQMGATLRIRF